MRLDDLDPSENVRDLGQGGGGGGFGGGGGNILFSLLPMLLGSRLGCGTIALIGIGLAIFMAIGGGGGLLTGGGVAPGGTGQQQQAGQNKACDTPEELQSCRMLRSTEQTWGQLVQGYRPPVLSFYQGGVQSGCGSASSAAGPFYCPADQGVYLDTSFFNELENRFGAAGDFARYYVIAHEVGHHIQNITGTMEKVRAAQSRMSRADGNAMSVRVELQANRAGFNATVSERIQRDIWFKLWGNLTMNPISALTGATTDRILDDELVRRHGHGIEPTPRALALWPSVREALRQLQEAIVPSQFVAHEASSTFVLAMADAAEQRGLGLMVGNMCGTSLAMAPAFLVAQRCRYVDLDGPLLQQLDRTTPMHFHDGLIEPPTAALWG